MWSAPARESGRAGSCRVCLILLPTGVAVKGSSASARREPASHRARRSMISMVNGCTNIQERQEGRDWMSEDSLDVRRKAACATIGDQAPGGAPPGPAGRTDGLWSNRPPPRAVRAGLARAREAIESHSRGGRGPPLYTVRPSSRPLRASEGSPEGRSIQLEGRAGDGDGVQPPSAAHRGGLNDEVLGPGPLGRDPREKSRRRPQGATITCSRVMMKGRSGATKFGSSARDPRVLGSWRRRRAWRRCRRTR